MIKKIIFTTISLIILVISITLIVKEKQEYSPNENRYLTTKIEFNFDKLLDGSFIENVEDYLTDQFPLRNTFLSLNTNFELLMGKKEINNVYISDKEYLIEKYNKPVNNDKIITVINNLSNNLKDFNLNLMLVPTSSEINKDLLPKNAITYNQKKEIDYIYDRVSVKTIDLYNTLNENNQTSPMYYRLDHHWTTTAAFYAYNEFANANSLEKPLLEDYKIETVSKDFNGTLYSKTNYYNYKPDIIQKYSLSNENLTIDYQTKKTNSLYSDKFLNEKDKYSYFLDNNHPLIVITNNDLGNDKEIVVLKDSYANCFVPFLTSNYEKVHVIDPRFYKYSITEYVENNQNIKDGLILYNMQTIDNDTGIISVR